MDELDKYFVDGSARKVVSLPNGKVMYITRSKGVRTIALADLLTKDMNILLVPEGIAISNFWTTGERVLFQGAFTIGNEKKATFFWADVEDNTLVNILPFELDGIPGQIINIDVDPLGKRLFVSVFLEINDENVGADCYVSDELGQNALLVTQAKAGEIWYASSSGRVESFLLVCQKVVNPKSKYFLEFYLVSENGTKMISFNAEGGVLPGALIKQVVSVSDGFMVVVENGINDELVFIGNDSSKIHHQYDWRSGLLESISYSTTNQMFSVVVSFGGGFSDIIMLFSYLGDGTLDFLRDVSVFFEGESKTPTMFSLDSSNPTPPVFDSTGRHLIWLGQDATTPPQIHTFDVSNWSTVTTQVLRTLVWDFPVSHSVEFHTYLSLGVHIPCHVVRPKVPNGKAFVFLHGGFWIPIISGNDRIVAQSLADMGYTVITPLFHGTDGFGREFMNKGLGYNGITKVICPEIDDCLLWVQQQFDIKTRDIVVGSESAGTLLNLVHATQSVIPIAGREFRACLTDLRFQYESIPRVFALHREPMYGSVEEWKGTSLLHDLPARLSKTGERWVLLTEKRDQRTPEKTAMAMAFAAENHPNFLHISVDSDHGFVTASQAVQYWNSRTLQFLFKD